MDHWWACSPLISLSLTNTHMVITLQHHSPIPSGPGLLHLCETLSGALDCFVLNSIITPNVKINSSSFKSFIFVFSLMRIKGEKKCLTFTCISKQTTKQSKFKYPTSLTGRDVNQSQPYMNMYVASLIQKWRVATISGHRKWGGQSHYDLF